jgi:WD40 repeat protein
MHLRFVFLPCSCCLALLTMQALCGEPPTAKTREAPRANGPPRTDRYGDPLTPGVVARLGTERFMLGDTRLLAFSPDGRRLAAHNEAQDLRVWDVLSGEVLFRLRTPLSTGLSGTKPLAFSPDGKAIALACRSEPAPGRKRQAMVRVWELATGKQLHCLGDLQGLGFNLVFSPDGRYLFSAGDQAPLLRWDLSGGGAAKEYGKFSAVFLLALSRDGKTLTAVTQERGEGSKRTLIRWDVATGKEIGRHALTRASRWGGRFSPDGSLFADADVDGKSIALLDPLTDRVRSQAQEADSPFLISISADGATMTSSSTKGSIRVWETATGKLRTRFKTPSTSVLGMALSPDGKWLALSSRADGSVHLWDVAAGRELHSFAGHRCGPLTLAFLKDGKEIVTVNRAGRPHPSPHYVTWSGDGRPTVHYLNEWADWSFRRWDAAAGIERAVRSPDPKGEVWLTSFSADGRLLATVIQDGTFHLWDVESGKELRSWKGPTRESTTTHYNGKERKEVVKTPYPATTPPAFSPDSKTLWAAYGSKIYRWETATGREQPAFEIKEIRQQMITWCLPAPDGRTLALWGTGIGQLTLLDSSSGKIKQLLKNIRPWECQPPAFSPDGRTIAVAERAAVSLWEVASGRSRGRLMAPRPASGLAFSPDGRLLALGAGPEAPLSLWDLATDQIVGRLPDDHREGQQIAFSPDGSRLAVAGYVRPAVFGRAVVTYSPVVLVCDVAEMCGKKKIEEIAQTAAPSEEELEGLWVELSGADNARAYRAIRQLGRDGPRGAAFLKARLKGDQSPDERRSARLIADLDGDEFATREKATAELEKLGIRAKPALRRALQGQASAEVRSRVKRLLERLGSPHEALPEPELIRLRVVEALEANGSPEARQLLTELAEGSEDTPLKQEAKASLARLRSRRLHQ